MTTTVARSRTCTVTTNYLQPPATDHPLHPLFVKHNLLRELAIEASGICERLAETPMTLADDHPHHRLTGDDRDMYAASKSRQRAYEHAAYELRNSLFAVIDNLGGM